MPYYQDPLSFYLLKNKAKQNQQGKKKKDNRNRLTGDLDLEVGRKNSKISMFNLLRNRKYEKIKEKENFNRKLK